MITKEQIELDKALCERTTGRPWRVGYASFTVEAGGMKVCDIRGWGYLTGTGGLNLSDEAAKAIQDANAEFIARARSALPEYILEIERLNYEIEMLRLYGNKMCTMMADDAIERKKMKGR